MTLRSATKLNNFLRNLAAILDFGCHLGSDQQNLMFNHVLLIDYNIFFHQKMILGHLLDSLDLVILKKTNFSGHSNFVRLGCIPEVVKRLSYQIKIATMQHHTLEIHSYQKNIVNPYLSGIVMTLGSATKFDIFFEIWRPSWILASTLDPINEFNAQSCFIDQLSPFPL